MDKKPHTKKEQSAWWVETRAALPARMKGWLGASFGMEPRRVAGIFKGGLLTQNPVLVLLLGLCAALGVSATLQGAVCMSAATVSVLLCSNLVLSLLRRRIPAAVGFPCAALVVAGFSTAADLLLQVYFPAQAEELGIFLPLLAANGLLLTRGADFALTHPPGYALVDGLATGLGYGAVVVALGAVRELVGGGTLWGAPVLGGGFHPVGLLTLPAGGLLLLGGLMAAFRFLTARRKDGKGGDAA